MNKRPDGPPEPILDPELSIIDAHHHLYVRPGVRYLLDEYLLDAQSGHRICASVYVETQAMARTDGPELLRPLGEIEFANGVAAMAASGQFGDCRVAAAIVGHADLRQGDKIAELLAVAALLSPDRLRGIRQIALSHPDPAVLAAIKPPPPAQLFAAPGFHAGMRQLARFGLSFDATVFYHQLDDLGRLAAAHPDVVIILDHMGLALGAGMEPAQREVVFHTWRASLRELAKRPNVMCKISGLGSPFWGFGFDRRATPASHLELAAAWGPYVDAAVEAFGAARCMMASNFAPDARSCGFVTLWNAFKQITKDCSADEKRLLFHDTAATVYRIATSTQRPPM